MNAVASVTTPKLMVLDLADLRESPSNPRKTFLDIEELAADIKVRGLLQPVLARPVPDGHELVFGHRRYRASKLAGVPTILAIVREMDDCEVLETQLVENGKRADIHPLEEAEGYEQLHQKHGKAVEDIVALTGKSKAYVYARMKLLALCPEARKAFYAGELTPSVALLIARLPHADLQKEAMKEVGPTKWNADSLSTREASDAIQQKFMLKLVEAPFDIADAKLVPSAGACGACPKRTGNQAELFADVDSADVCTDPKCFDKKRDAEWKRRTAIAKETGATVIEGKAAAKLFHYGSLAYDSGLVDLDKETYAGDKRVTPRKLLKGRDDIKITLARDPEGGIHELVTKGVFDNAAAKVKKDHPTATSVYEKKAREDRKAEKAKIAAEKAARRPMLVAVVAAAEKRPTMTDEVLRMLGGALAWNVGLEDMIERRAIVVKGKYEPGCKEVGAMLRAANGAELRGLVVELACCAHTGREAGDGTILDSLCDAYAIDTRAIVKATAADPKAWKKTYKGAKPKAKTVPKPTPAKKKAARK